MVKSCLVATCKNTQGVPGITFHKIGKKRYANRLRAIGRSTDENLSPQNVICSKHFAVDDFVHFNGKKYLKLEALPRLFLPRRPSIIIEQKLDTKIDIPDRKTNSSTINNNNTLDCIDSDIDSWLIDSLLYQDMDLLILTSSQNDNIDMELNQTNLSVYPTNDFLTSLISDSCDIDTFGLFDEDTSGNLLEI